MSPTYGYFGLLADHAGTASQLLPCHICGWAILPGQRAARLTDGTGRWIHVADCAARLGNQ
jgi:hypothetical protein